MRYVGHKGADRIRPGNTLESFAAAVELGVDMVELDVLWTPDGHPRMAVSERSPLIVAHDWEDARRRRPLTLAETLDAFTEPPLDRVEIDCDVKLPGREDELAEALRERGLTERAMVSTMELSTLEKLGALAPELRRGWTYPKVGRDWASKRWAIPAVMVALALMRRRAPGIAAAELPRMGVEAMWVYHQVITPRLVAATRAADVELIAWTVDDPGAMRGWRGWASAVSAATIPGCSPSSPEIGGRPPQLRLELGVVESGSATATANGEGLAPGTVMALVAMGLGVLVIANDFTALNVALPSIEHDLDTDVGTSQWVINAYALTFGMAIVTGGKLADMFGRRKVFFIGSVIFAAFSFAGGLAPNTGLLIAARVGMGIGGALMWPAILGMTFAALPESKAGLAGGLILGAAGIGNAMGPLIGGALADLASWRWIFFLNVPIAALAMLVTYLKVHQPPVEVEERRIDYGGIVTLSLALVFLLVAMDQAADWGWGDPRVVGLFVLAALLAVAFAFVEPRMKAAALVPGDIIANRPFTAACLATLLMSAVFFTTVLYAPQLMQKILGYSPLKSGVGMLPMLAVFAATSFIAGPLYNRIGGKTVVTAGTVGLVIGPFLLSRFGADSGYTALIPGLVITGIGVGLFYPSVTTAAVTSLDPSRSSLAGGIVYMFQIAGGAVGLGLATTIFTTTSQSQVADDALKRGLHMSDGQAAVVHGSLAGTETGEQVIHQFPQAASKLLDVVSESFVAGVSAAFEVISAIAVGGFLVSLLFVGGSLLGQRRQG